MQRLKEFLYLHRANTADPTQNQFPIMPTEQQTIQKSIHKTQAAQTRKRERMQEKSLKTCIWEKQIKAGEDSYNFATVETFTSIHTPQLQGQPQHSSAAL